MLSQPTTTTTLNQIILLTSNVLVICAVVTTTTLIPGTSAWLTELPTPMLIACGRFPELGSSTITFLLYDRSHIILAPELSSQIVFE